MSDVNSNIYKKLLSVKKQVSYIKKDKESYQYSYATPTMVLGTINPILNEAGLLLKSEVINVSTERVFVKYKKDKTKNDLVEEINTLYNLYLKFTWVDVDSGEKDENLFFASGINGDEKGVGSALTYGERYFMLKYFNIPTDDDDPDSFQEKFETEEAAKKRIDKENKEILDKDLLTLNNCKSKEDVKKIWPNIINKKHEDVINILNSFKDDK